VNLTSCPNFNLMAYRQDPVRGWIAFRLRCKSWRCPYCAIENQKMWRKHLKRRIIDLGGEWYFGTITAPAWNRTPEKTLEVIRANFDRFMKRLKRVFKKGVQYVRIYEKHEKGAFHLHIILSGLSPKVERYKARSGSTAFKPASDTKKAGVWAIKTWWKKTLSKCGCGYIADIKPIPAVQAIGYVTEYMTKTAQDYSVKNLRRIQTSRGIGSPNERSVEIWAVSEVIWGGSIGHQSFIDLSTKTKIPAEYWLDHIVYPPPGEKNS
jgi:hypothetical protein